MAQAVQQGPSQRGPGAGFHMQQSWSSSAPASADGRNQRGNGNGEETWESGRDSSVREVWAETLDEEMERMRDTAEEYRYVAMETVFPGIVARPMGPFKDYLDHNYQVLKVNVELMKVIQVAFTFSDAQGRRPLPVSTWRFNFSFDPKPDLFAEEALDALRRRRGTDLEKLRMHGIDPMAFGELLVPSGLVLNEDIKWITFLGTRELSDRVAGQKSAGVAVKEHPWIIFSGMYDFGFLLRLLTSKALPEELSVLYADLDLFFPTRVDLAKFVGLIPNGDRQLLEKPEYFKDSQRLLEAFFKLPASVQAAAFDKEQTAGVGEDSEANKGSL